MPLARAKPVSLSHVRENPWTEVADCSHVKTCPQAPGQLPLPSGVSFPSP